jgi:hypothetical protein
LTRALVAVCTSFLRRTLILTGFLFRVAHFLRNNIIGFLGSKCFRRFLDLIDASRTFFFFDLRVEFRKRLGTSSSHSTMAYQSSLSPDGVIGRANLWIADDFWVLRFRLMVETRSALSGLIHQKEKRSMDHLLD